jgi:hypothetical protein
MPASATQPSRPPYANTLALPGPRLPPPPDPDNPAGAAVPDARMWAEVAAERAE